MGGEIAYARTRAREEMTEKPTFGPSLTSIRAREATMGNRGLGAKLLRATREAQVEHQPPSGCIG